MGGVLSVTSELGQGTTFDFSVDVEVDSRPIDFDSDKKSLAGRRALVVVKSQPLGDNFVQRLDQHGIYAVHEISIAAAIDALNMHSANGQPLELVLTDIQLEDGDAVKLAQQIRQTEQFARLPIVFLANTNSKNIKDARASLGIDHQLLKPVKDSDLISCIDLLLNGSDGYGEQSEQRLSDPFVIPNACLNILVAEDNKVNQKLMTALLSRAGHNPVLAENGLEVVKRYQSDPFDLIFMDVQMPEMDGFDATYEIRKLQADSGNRTPIVALTAHASPADRNRCLAAGMDEYLSKPVRADTLYEMIERLTGNNTTISQAKSEVQPANVKVVDWAAAFETVGGDRELLKELIKMINHEKTHH